MVNLKSLNSSDCVDITLFRELPTLDSRHQISPLLLWTFPFFLSREGFRRSRNISSLSESAECLAVFQHRAITLRSLLTPRVCLGLYIVRADDSERVVHSFSEDFTHYVCDDDSLSGKPRFVHRSIRGGRSLPKCVPSIVSNCGHESLRTPFPEFRHSEISRNRADAV